MRLGSRFGVRIDRIRIFPLLSTPFPTATVVSLDERSWMEERNRSRNIHSSNPTDSLHLAALQTELMMIALDGKIQDSRLMVSKRLGRR